MKYSKHVTESDGEVLVIIRDEEKDEILMVRGMQGIDKAGAAIWVQGFIEGLMKAESIICEQKIRCLECGNDNMEKTEFENNTTGYYCRECDTEHDFIDEKLQLEDDGHYMLKRKGVWYD